jgi:hypothetical protein
VNLPNGESTWGCLRRIDYNRNIATISMGPFPDFREASLDQHLELGSKSDVVAFCRSGTGEVKLSNGVVTKRSIELYGQRLNMSTCKIPQVHY